MGFPLAELQWKKRFLRNPFYMSLSLGELQWEKSSFKNPLYMSLSLAELQWTKDLVKSFLHESLASGTPIETLYTGLRPNSANSGASVSIIVS